MQLGGHLRAGAVGAHLLLPLQHLLRGVEGLGAHFSAGGHRAQLVGITHGAGGFQIAGINGAGQGLHLGGGTGPSRCALQVEVVTDNLHQAGHFQGVR